MSATGSLIDELVRLDRHQCRDLVEQARCERQRRIHLALERVRRELLPMLSDNRAACAIDDAVRGRRASFLDKPALRTQVEQELRQELGSLDDVPGSERIRQLLGACPKSPGPQSPSIDLTAADRFLNR
jgi:hypothetical protein